MNYCHGTACDFMGMAIRVGVVAEAPELHITNFAIVPNGKPILTSSFSYDVLHVLEFALNFTYSLRVFKTTGVYSTKRARWSGMTAFLMKNKTDLGLGHTSDLIARRQVVDYNFAMATTKALALFRKPEFVRDGTSVLQPFDTYAWFGITSWAVFTAVSLVFFQRLLQQKRGSFVEDVSSGIHMWATLLCSKGLQTPRSHSIRIIVIVTSLTVITLTGVYTGILVSFLTATSDVFRNLNQLLRTNYEFVMDEYSQALRLRMEEAKSSHVRQLSQRMRNSGHADFADAKSDLMRGSYVFITTDSRAYESLQHNFSNNERCFIGILRLTMGSTKHGTIVQKNSPWKRPIDCQIQRFKQFGFNHIWNRRYRSQKPTCEEMPYQPIYLTSVIVSVYIFGAGMASGLFFLIVELLYRDFVKLRYRNQAYLD